jgi:hypothetical protein
MMILCPRNYTYRKNLTNTRKFFQYGVSQTKLTHDVEYAVMKVLEK